MTVAWGATFVMVQDAVAQIPVFRFLGLRFGIAALALILFGGLRGVRKKDLIPGSLAGAALFGGYAFQTLGLQHTSASNAGFITGMFVVFTPLLLALSHRRWPSGSSLLGAVVAASGLYLLTSPGKLELGYGNSLVLACALSFALHILVLDRFSKRMPSFRFATLQICFVALLASMSSAAVDRSQSSTFSTQVWIAVVVTALVASALAFYVQTRAQMIVPPARTAIILTAEPVFAGIFGALAGDRIGLLGLVGAGLILLGILIAEFMARGDKALTDPLTSPA